MKKIAFSIILCVISLSLFSQDFNIPKDYKLVKVEDYALYENDIISCVDWLMNTPLDENLNKRKEANAFLIKWLSGSPNVHIEIKQEIVTFMSTSPDLLMIFMGGWAKYSIKTKDYNNNVEGSMAGIESVIAFYTKNKKLLKKDRKIEKYIKRQKKGTLKKYIEKNA